MPVMVGEGLSDFGKDASGLYHRLILIYVVALLEAVVQ